MKPSEKLIERLRKDGLICKDTHVKFERCYHGHWQRSAGAWSWWIHEPGGCLQIGSCFTVKDCLAADYFEHVGVGEIVPEKRRRA